MLKAIIEELSKIAPCYSLESFNVDKAIITPLFFVVDISETETIGRFSHKTLFVYMYAPLSAHYLTMVEKKEIIKHLHKKRLSKKEEEGDFWIEYKRASFSKVDKTVNKRCVCMEFFIPAL